MTVTLKQILEFEEGLRLEPYLCPAGHWTIGVGWNLEAHGLPAWVCKEFFHNNYKISRETAYKLLEHSLLQVDSDVIKWVSPITPGYNDARQRAVKNMAFQLGYTRLSGFKKTRQYVHVGQWRKAAVECLDSKWAREDSPERAHRVSEVFETGDDSFYEQLI